MTKIPPGEPDELFDAADERGFFPEKRTRNSPATAPAPATDTHYHGHRDRLRARYREHGDAALADYEILELILFRLIPRRDTKPIAKALLAASARLRPSSALPCTSFRKSKASESPLRSISSSSPPPATACSGANCATSRFCPPGAP